jgi:predicted permease
VPPALLVNWLGCSLPPVLVRPVELLSDGMIPTMLVALGVQLAAAGLPRLDADMAVASAVRLIGGPALAAPIGIEVSPAAPACFRPPCRRRCWPGHILDATRSDAISGLDTFLSDSKMVVRQQKALDAIPR